MVGCGAVIIAAFFHLISPSGALLLNHVLKCAKEDGNIDFIYL